jgi:formate hydrogenlyase subunit 5
MTEAVTVPVDELAHAARDAHAAGERFAGLFAESRPSGPVLHAVFSSAGHLAILRSELGEGATHYPSLTPFIDAAAWYERRITDLFGLIPIGHPRPEPLVLPRAEGVAPPWSAVLSPQEPPARERAGGAGTRGEIRLDTRALPAHLHGEGVFTLPYGPVRSGVYESVGYVLETPGEDIPHLRPRIYYKHRGVEQAFSGRPIGDAVLAAERVEGVASLSHAIAFCRAVEEIGSVVVPEPAQLVRVIHAELERIANHLDTIYRHTEGAGQSVASSRFSSRKEQVLRLQGQMCGSRFGRGVVVPGGIAGQPEWSPPAVAAELDRIEKGFWGDSTELIETPSFLDRLRGTGVLPSELASRYGLLGPVGRGSYPAEDTRASRAYGGYRLLGFASVVSRTEGDALARHEIRLEEIGQSFHLIRQALDALGPALGSSLWRSQLPEHLSGTAISSAEAPQGEVLYVVELSEGRVVTVTPRSASFHNFAAFQLAFPKDIYTDFVFIEASFGISLAGVAL